MTVAKITFPNSYEINKKNINKSKVASIIILYREVDIDRKINLFFTLDWIKKYFGDIFEVIVVEQDSQRKLILNDNYSFVNYYFLYNDQDFNRGWGFNCAIKYFCTTDVIALIDSDLILHKSFLDCVMLVYHGKYDIVSPYNSLYYTTAYQKKQILSNVYAINIKIAKSKLIKRKPTIAGGILIIRKETYIQLGGIEEYKHYGAEDDAFSINIQILKGDRLYVNKELYIHLYHNKDGYVNEKIMKHFEKYYKNKKNKITTEKQKGLFRKTLITMNIHRRIYIGNIDLYKESKNNYINSISPYESI